MFENITKFFKKITKKQNIASSSKDTAKERLHLVLMQDRANVSADFLDLMRQEIIDVIKKYIEVDESAIDVRLTNKENEDGTNGAPALYANIPIINIKEEAKKEEGKLAKEKKENLNSDSKDSQKHNNEVKKAEDLSTLSKLADNKKEDTLSDNHNDANQKDNKSEENELQSSENNLKEQKIEENNKEKQKVEKIVVEQEKK